MRRSDSDTLEEFEAAVAEVPNVVRAQRLFGDPDYLLRVVAKDLNDFQRLYDDTSPVCPASSA
jgi:DNA-binding Lrp family transcriptional regulator